MDSLSQHLRSDLLGKTRQLTQLTRMLRACLPVNCQQHLAVASIKDGQLVLVTDSPVWVNRLRMYTQSMLDMLAEHSDVNVTQIRIRRSTPGPKKPEPPPAKHRHLSQHSSRLISRTAESIDDEELQQALLKLAKNTVEGE